MNPTSTLGGAILAAAIAMPAVADGHRAQPPLDPAYAEECGSCHVAFHPRTLGARSWAAILGDLAAHFGVDASLEPEAAQSILRYLTANARRKETLGADGEPVLRITKTSWFVREHDAADAALWSSPAVKSAANCAACHPGAAQGSFAEHDIRIPR